MTYITINLSRCIFFSKIAFEIFIYLQDLLMKLMFNTLLLFFCLTRTFAQPNNSFEPILSNNWYFEFNFGKTNPLEPFGDGFVSDTALKKTSLNNFKLNNLSARYMFNPYAGLIFGLSRNEIKGYSRISEIKFDNVQYGINIESAIGLGRLLKIQQNYSNFDIYLHSGIMVSRFFIKSNVVKLHEDVLGITFGMTPSYKLNDYMSLKSDLLFMHNLSQQRTWDGLSYNRNGSYAKLYNFSLGIIFFFK